MREICELLNEESWSGRKLLVDLGAADGFYAIGALQAGLFEYAYCYESSDRGRAALQKNAILNGVADKIECFGEAKENCYRALPNDKFPETLFLVDIEGAEFDLFNTSTFKTLSRATIIIELHHEFLKDGQNKLNTLLEECQSFFIPKLIRTGERDLSPIVAIETFTDIDKWLLCAEGRPRDALWVLLRPKH